MAEQAKFAIVGCGDACLRYGDSFKSVENGRLVLAMDIEAEVAGSFGELYGVPATDRIEDVLDNKDIDAVIVVLPHYLHAPVTIQCAKAGKHVLCEKPMATTTDDAEAMEKACREAGVKLGLSFAARYKDDTLKARDLLQKKVIGDIFSVNLTSFGTKSPDYWTGGYRKRVITHWRKSVKEAGGGVLIMNMVHSIDIMRFITGLEVTRVTSEYGTFATPVEVEDTLYATMKFDNGALGSITASTAAFGGGDGKTFILGTEGQMVLKGGDIEVYVTSEKEGLKADEWTKIECEKSESPYTPYEPLVRDFAQCILDDTEPPVLSVEGKESLRIIEGIYEAGRTGQAVSLSR